jgi:hypothetical protein
MTITRLDEMLTRMFLQSGRRGRKLHVSANLLLERVPKLFQHTSSHSVTSYTLSVARKSDDKERVNDNATSEGGVLFFLAVCPSVLTVNDDPDSLSEMRWHVRGCLNVWGGRGAMHRSLLTVSLVVCFATSAGSTSGLLSIDMVGLLGMRGVSGGRGML